MRHLKAGRKLGRTSAHRKALFRNLITALIERERIRTTLAKAKELRSKVEKTITLGKKGTLHARRRALRMVTRKDIMQKLFGDLAERYAERNGGYTRIIRVGNRRGDDAPMAFIELVDREEETPKEEKPAKAAKTREKEKKEAAPAGAGKKQPKKKAVTAKKTAPEKGKKKEEKKPGKPKAAPKPKKASAPKKTESKKQDKDKK